MIECPGSNCDILVDDQTVMKLVKEAKVKLKYQQLITNSFVQVMIKETEVNETINSRKNFVKLQHESREFSKYSYYLLISYVNFLKLHHKIFNF